MRPNLRAELLARCLLTVGALLCYWPLLTFDVVLVSDDDFTSDIWNGELPLRVLLGRVMAHGELPVWSNQLCSGVPLSVGGYEPVSLALFRFLPTAAALDTLLIFLILVAAHGTYGLSRRMGATRPGSVLAGIAFAVSGYMVCQLKHLGIISTVVWLPWGLTLLDRGLAAMPAFTVPDSAPVRSSRVVRALYLLLFGLVFAEQVLAGFPQSAYICALCYGAFALYRVCAADHPPGTPWRLRYAPLLAAAVVAVLGAAVGAVALLPLAELGSLSDRGVSKGFEWATGLRYWPRNFITFLLPYANGDASDASYVKPPGSLFWEEYGYVGIATFLLAIYGAIADRSRGSTRFLSGMTVLAYLLVLGPATPLFRIAYEVIPGLKLFRCPTRFLVVVDLGLCVLAAIGLSRLEPRLGSILRRFNAERAARAFVILICLGTTLDLFIHQPRQNAMVPAPSWLATPYTARMVQDDTLGPGHKRVFTPFRMEFHVGANRMARGWSDLRPYYMLRDLVEPNANAFWDLPAADCYMGIAPSWHIDVWGDHNRGPLLMYNAIVPVRGEKRLHAQPAFANLMRAYGVTHVIAPYPIRQLEPAMPMPTEGFEHDVLVYRIPGASRVRVVSSAERASSSQDAVKRLLAKSFDPDALLFLHDAPASAVAQVGPARAHPGASAKIERERGDEVVVRANAPAGGFLLLADTFYPGWSAEVDGRATPLYRANISVRAVALPPGEHRVRFFYRGDAFAHGLTITLFALGLFALGFAFVLVLLARARHARRAALR